MTRPEQREQELKIASKLLEELRLTPLSVKEGPNPPDVLVHLPDRSPIGESRATRL